MSVSQKLLSRVYLNGNEDCAYPLKDVYTEYPDNLITGVRVLVPRGIHHVYVSSLSVTDNKVLAVLSYLPADGTTKQLLGTAECNTSDKFMVARIKNASGESIGWMSFGSGSEQKQNHDFESEIDPTCIHERKGTTDGDMLYIGNTPYPISGILNIRISGLQQNEDNGAYVFNTTTEDPIDPVPEGITSINNVPLRGSGTVRITMPNPGYDENNTSTMFCLKNGGHSNTLLVADNVLVDEDTQEVSAVPNKDTRIKPYLCPGVFSLLDYVKTSQDLWSPKQVARYSEPCSETSTIVRPIPLPLDNFVQWFRENINNKAYGTRPDKPTDPENNNEQA